MVGLWGHDGPKSFPKKIVVTSGMIPAKANVLIQIESRDLGKSLILPYGNECHSYILEGRLPVKNQQRLSCLSMCLCKCGSFLTHILIVFGDDNPIIVLPSSFIVL